MTRYASNTSVSVEKSRGEIEATLRRYGCVDFAYRTSARSAQIAFQLHERMIRFELELPDQSAAEFTKSPSGRRKRTAEQSVKAWEQACRQRWRALALVIKAKLEAVESGITTFDVEFLPHMIVPGGKVFHEVALPAVAQAYETGRMPPLLGGG